MEQSLDRMWPDAIAGDKDYSASDIRNRLRATSKRSSPVGTMRWAITPMIGRPIENAKLLSGRSTASADTPWAGAAKARSPLSGPIWFKSFRRFACEHHILLAVNKFAHDIHVSGMGGGFRDDMQDHIAKIFRPGSRPKQ